MAQHVGATVSGEPPASDYPDLASLALFHTVVARGSLAQAARAFAIAPPSASARVRSLERRLGVRLLDRSTAGSTPTAAGRRLAEETTILLVAVRAFEEAVRVLRPGRGSTLRIAASYTIGEQLLPAWLRHLGSVLPDAHVEVAIVNSIEVVRAVTVGDAELGFVESPAPMDPLHERVVATDELLVVVPPNHGWAGRSITAPELAATPLVLRERGSGTRDALEAALATIGLALTPPMLSLGSTAAVRAVAMSGGGPAVLSALTVSDELAQGTLVAVPVEQLALRRLLRAVWTDFGAAGPIATAVLDLAASTAWS